jgi:phospholipid/cholesterol/gamma-HCH transport system substrate-binding protein
VRPEGESAPGKPSRKSSGPASDRGSALARVLTIGAVAAAIVLIAVLVLGGSSGHHYKLLFQTGGQLVKGNEVQIGGSPVGTVDSLTLTPDNQAEIAVTVDQQLHEGTTAIIRSTSLSGVANHYISLSPGPDNAPKLADDATLHGDSTTTPVDLDQLFDTFNARTRRGLQGVIQGFAATYSGNTKQANETYKYFAPSLSATDRLLKELGSDQQVLTDFLVNGGKVVTAIAERRNDLTSLVSNANTALGAVADQNRSLDQALQVLPPTLRQANTTFVNLRAALDDLDPLVNTSKRATKNLNPFLLRLRPVLHRAVPVFTNLRRTVTRPGPHNDLGELVKELVPLHKRGAPASRTGIRALNASQPTIAFARPYAPDLIGSFSKLGSVSGYYDGNGHYARVEAASFNVFSYDQLTQNLVPIPPQDKFNGFDFNLYTPCPGSTTQPVAGSNPFLDQGNLNGECDPSDVPPGP